VRVTTITCDRCKKEIIDLSQIWPVEVKISKFCGNHLSAEWCRSCTIEMGMIDSKDEVTAQPRIEPKPTIEDFIREIAREEIEASRS